FRRVLFRSPRTSLTLLAGSSAHAHRNQTGVWPYQAGNSRKTLTSSIRSTTASFPSMLTQTRYLITGPTCLSSTALSAGLSSQPRQLNTLWGVTRLKYPSGATRETMLILTVGEML